MTPATAVSLPRNFGTFEAHTPEELRRVELHECGEPMVALQSAAPSVPCKPVLRETNDLLGTELMFARQSVAERLTRAQDIFTALADRQSDLIPPGSRLLVGYAYRLPEVQRDYFTRAREMIRTAMPHLLSDAEIDAETFNYVNFPELAGHPAGAAIDVTIIDASGSELDIGTPFLSLDDRAHLPVSAYRETDSTIHARRMLLRQAMMQAGFAPYEGEWWHFSFGDREWAAFYHESHAVYGEVPRTKLPLE